MRKKPKALNANTVSAKVWKATNSGLLENFSTLLPEQWQTQEEALGYQTETLTKKLINLPAGINQAECFQKAQSGNVSQQRDGKTDR